MKLPAKRLFSLAAAVLILVLPDAILAQTYKYVDENGAVFFVDSIDKIPPPYRKNMKVIQGSGRDEKVPQKPNTPIPEQSLLGRWEHEGVENGNSYTVIMTLRPKGVFDGNGYKKMGEKTFVWMFKGNWKIMDGDLALTYTWSSASEPKRGSTQWDAILEVNDQFLELKSGRTGEVYRYVRK